MKHSFLFGTSALFLFCLFSAGCVGLAIGSIEDFYPVPEYLKNILNQVGMFLVPSLLFARSFYDRGDTLHIRNSGKIKDYALFALLLLGTVPLVSYIQMLNEAITFPESMLAIESFFREFEQQAQESLLRLVSGTSPQNLFFAMLSVAVFPAICEECFFRGIVLNNLLKRTQKIHLSIWISALFFSFMHFQFFGFFPRVIMGGILGYAFLLSKSLWIPIVLHFLNNGTVVVTYFLYNKHWISTNPKSLESHPFPIWTALASLIIGFLLLRIIFYRDNKAHSNSA